MLIGAVVVMRNGAPMMMLMGDAFDALLGDVYSDYPMNGARDVFMYFPYINGERFRTPESSKS